MTLKQTLTAFDMLDDSLVTGESVAAAFHSYSHVTVTTKTVKGESGSTDFIKIVITGTDGKKAGGNAPTLGIIGRLGGIGARPGSVGMVSDADGAVAAITAALKLADMSEKGDSLPGDVIITTHICPDAPTLPHEPVDFMDSPVDMPTMNQYEIAPDMDAIISVDTTKGNRVINHKGIALSPTVKSGYILRVNEDLLRIMEMTTGKFPVTYPITMQDITPYGNGVYHINSILQPSVSTDVPVVGLAVTAESIVPGCGTGASHEVDIASAARFTIEAAKEFTAAKFSFYDEEEFERLTELYGSMKILQTDGKTTR
ncbi:DUF1177 domain-containing protein [Virgibacillus oceani]